MRSTKALRFCGRLGEAEARALEGLAMFSDLTDLVFEQSLIAMEAGRFDKAHKELG